MKLKEFRKKMRKDIFSTAEARIVCRNNDPATLNLQLHQWRRTGDMVRLKRGLYMFTDSKPDAAEIARNLCSPCCFSLEYILNMRGIMPEAVFAYTLVTPKITRRFETPAGTFIYHKIKREAFTGFDAETLMAEKEKALTDYFYLHRNEFAPNGNFWKESRLETAATHINANKLIRYANLFKSAKLNILINSFLNYAKSRETH